MQTTTYNPKSIVAFGHTPIAIPVTIAAGQNLAAGTMLGRITSSGLHVAYDDDGADDGRRTAVGFLVEKVDASSTGTNQNTVASMYIAFGLLKTDQLVGVDANGLADIDARSIAGHNITILGGGSPYAFTGDLTVGGDVNVGVDLDVAGASVLDGALSVGGLTTLTGGLTFGAPTTGTDTAFSILATHNVVICADFTTGRSYALPAAATYGIGRLLVVQAPSNANTHNLTLDGNSTETINGAETLVVNTALQTKVLMAVTGGWIVVSSS